MGGDDQRAQRVVERTIVLPEGNAERSLVDALLEFHDVGGVQVLRDGGNSTFDRQLAGIQPIVAAGEIDTIVIVADNDDRPAGIVGDIQTQIQSAEGLTLPVPQEDWQVEPGDPSMAILTLPMKGEKGTVETLIWSALGSEYPEPTDAAEDFIGDMPTGRCNSLTTREKARFSAALAATCEYDPSCMVHWMWQSNKGYRSLLGHECFEDLVTFLARI